MPVKNPHRRPAKLRASRYNARRMANVYAGTSGWAYPSWRPDFYPAKLGSAKFLAYYASRLNSVEVNFTFRNLPTKNLLNDWLAVTPPNFLFAVKAHQGITHFKRLRCAAGATAKFIASLKPLLKAGKLGPLLFQLPPNFKCDLPLLEKFLPGIPRHVRATFEFRHPSWFREEVFAALRKANIALCRAESEKLETPDVQTADFSYLRLRKDKYSPKARKELAARIARLARQGDVFLYFKHQDTPEGALHAERLLAPVTSKK
jgi:uncharacterized protein YecE (DUF72 family)